MKAIMIQHRQQATSLARAFINSHRARLAAGIERSLRPYLREGERMPDFTLGLDVVGRTLEEQLERLLAAEQAKTEELAGEYRPHEELRKASREVQSRLVSTRRLLRGLYGAEIAVRIVEGPIAQTTQPSLLLSQGTHVVRQLWEVDLESLGRLPRGCELDTIALAHDLDLAVTWLDEAQQDVERRRHKLHSILAEKARRLREFDAAFRAAVRFTKGLCHMADRPDLADRIKAGWLEGVK